MNEKDAVFNAFREILMLFALLTPLRQNSCRL
jgi:hypothetical protein